MRETSRCVISKIGPSSAKKFFRRLRPDPAPKYGTAATAIFSAGTSPPRLEPTAYWNLRSAALEWSLRGGHGFRTMAADPRGS